MLLLLSRVSCVRLCDPIDGSPPGSAIPGILQARTLEWVAVYFSNPWKLSRSVVSDSSRPHGLQPTRLLCPWDFPGKSTGVGCHCLLWSKRIDACYYNLLAWGVYCYTEFFFFNLFIFNWRITALQCCVGFGHTSTRISHRYTYVSLSLDPPSDIPPHPTM